MAWPLHDRSVPAVGPARFPRGMNEALFYDIALMRPLWHVRTNKAKLSKPLICIQPTSVYFLRFVTAVSKSFADRSSRLILVTSTEKALAEAPHVDSEQKRMK